MAKLLPRTIIIATVAAFASSGAAAGSPDGAWFNSLKQNVTGASCCNVADCKITTADWRGGDNGQWWADVQGEMTPIPRDKELKNRPSPDGEAYVCASYARQIFCFVPPNLGF